MNEEKSVVQQLDFDLPELSLQVVSFMQIASFIMVATLVYLALRKGLSLVKNTGVIEKKTLFFKTVNALTFVIPTFIFLYGLTTVSQDSLFLSLLFFVVFSIVIGFSLVEPVKALLASGLIHLRGDVQVGDYIHIGIVEGEVQTIGAINIVIQTRSGSRSFIPTHQILQQSYEIHAKKGGPSISINIPADKIKKKDVEKLAHLCPYKKKNSDIRLSTQDGIHKLHIEVINRECRPWVNKYFEQHAQN
ncbi:MAG: mechanosensitive ion channel family protein [Bdellovibrionales bacterium]|nr:mechanosensitive ion channel family protein [Bdellovibrionales bacterium]NQZ18246.1 mechanosensitive ion channel family protein [Bdellovibrionales bacterium]